MSKQICAESTLKPDPILPEDIGEAKSWLCSKKTADEQGLPAEHLKHSVKVLIQEITDILITFYLRKKSQKYLELVY